MPAFSKLNRHEFIQYWRERESPEREQVELKAGLLYLVGLLPFVILNHEYDFNTEKEMGTIVGLVTLCYMIAMPLVWIGLFGPPVRIEFHRCPSCSKTLVQANRMVVVATSRCGCCAETILEDARTTATRDWLHDVREIRSKVVGSRSAVSADGQECAGGASHQDSPTP